MNKKVIGIFICMIMITSLFTFVTPAGKKTKDNMVQQPLITTSQVNVPVWDSNDQWIYKIEDVNIHFNSTSGIIDAHLAIDELPLIMKTIDETTYTLEFETTIKGNAQVNMDMGGGPVDVTITFPNLQLSGEMVFEKSTLGIKALTGDFLGRFWVKINEQPFFPIPWLPTFPVKLKVSSFTSDFSTSMTPVMFPLNENMSWNFSATNLTLNGEARSPWFYIIQWINAIYPFLTPEIAALLPIVDINEALTTIGMPNPLVLPMIETAFYCLNTESVTVPARTYNAYNITILGGMAHCYYAPDAGNIIKLTGNLQELIPFITNINMELLSTTYS